MSIIVSGRIVALISVPKYQIPLQYQSSCVGVGGADDWGLTWDC